MREQMQQPEWPVTMTHTAEANQPDQGSIAPPPMACSPSPWKTPLPIDLPPHQGWGRLASCRHPSTDQAWSAPIRAGQLDPTSAWTHAPGL